MAKTTQRKGKAPDGYIRPKDPANISQNPAPLQPNPPSERAPLVGATHVVEPPAK
jgi:hypothetical protein